MIIVSAVLAVFGVVSILFGLSCYRHSRQWARECRGVMLAIAYKNKVKMSPSLEEIILWARKTDGGGQAFYGMGGTRIAVINRVKVPRQRKRQPSPNGAPVREGTWTARDETVRAK